jgi:glycosyltransferase involved in cell wall biosynthesis
MRRPGTLRPFMEAPSQTDGQLIRALTLVSSDVAPVGGMERAAFELCSRLLERGWQLTVIARSCALPRHPRLRFVRLYSPSRPVSLALGSDLVLGSLALARRRQGVVQAVNPIVCNRVDVVQAQFCEQAFRRLGLSRSRRDTVAYRLNSWLASWVSLLLERWSYRPGRVRHVACVSAGLERDIESFYPRVRGRVGVIPNGVDWGAFAPSDERRAGLRSDVGISGEELVALFVGGDWHRKGLVHAIEAVARADGWTLVVLGAGDRREFEDLAAARRAADRVRFAGKVADPVPYYLAADAFVGPSHYEAFSLAALEGAAAGLPLIIPRMNGSEELIDHGVNGWFTPRDGAAIAERLSQLRDDPTLRAAMSRAARRSAERFDWERVVDEFEALYAELLSARG